MASAYILLGLLGLIIGSFLSVVAHRVPIGESIVTGRSRCPACGVQIRAIDNVPLLSWIVLRGRCRDCGEPIPVRYPLIEAAVAIGFVASLARFSGDDAEVALGCLLIATLVVITLTDLEHRIIPNAVLIAATVAWGAVAIPFADEQVVEGLISAGAAGGALGIVAFAYPKGMGMGDVKLVAVMGLYLGSAVAVGLLAGLLAGASVGLAMIARHGSAARKQAIPFGPFLALGGVIALFAGPEVVDWYTESFFS